MTAPSNKFIAIVQARMSSSRLPGKVMELFAGKPALHWLIESLLQVIERKSICIATSNEPQSDAIAEFCKSNNIHYYRGDETNVASRFLGIVNRFSCDYFIRLNADSPLLDYRIAKAAMKQSDDSRGDLITTISDQPYPSGMNVEIIKRSIFIENYPLFSSAGHFEHVTKYFYENENRFNIIRLKCPVENAKRYKFSLDTEEDKARLECIFNRLTLPHYEYTLGQKCSIQDSCTPERAIEND